MRLFVLFVLFAVAALGTEVVDTPSESMEAMEALVQRHQYGEALFRLPNVLPFERGQKWDELVEQAACGHLEISASSVRNFEEEAQSLIKVFPRLSRSEKFRRTIRQLMLEGFERCLKSRGEAVAECSYRLTEYAKKNTDDVSLLLKAGDLLSNFVGPKAAFPVFLLGLKTTEKSLVCSFVPFQKSVESMAVSQDKKLRELASLAARNCQKAQKAKRK